MDTKVIIVAWRNLWRNRVRTCLTAAAICISCAVLVFFIGLQMSSYSSAINASTSIFQSHAQIQMPGYIDKPEVRKVISDISELRRSIAAIEKVQAASARALGFAFVSSEERSYGAQIVGVEPEKEQIVSSIAGLIREGAYLADENAYEAVLGRTLARNLKASIGDELTFMGQAADGSLAAGVVKIVGIFESGSDDFDRLFIQIPLKPFQDIFYMPEQGHAVAIRVADPDNIEGFINSLQNKLSSLSSNNGHRDLSVLGWEQLSPGLRQAIELDMASGWLFYLSLIAVVTFCVLNTFLMSILERTREFGMLLALGMLPGRIIKMIIFECLALLITGTAPGVALGTGLILYYGRVGFYVPGSEEVMKLWNLPAAVYTEMSWIAATLGPSILLVASVLFVFVAAQRIRTFEPVEAMRSL